MRKIDTNNYLSIENMTVSYGNNNVLKDINLELQSGKVNILIGVNGAGKTTLLKSICGLTDSINGNIKYNGKDLIGINDKERGKLISYIPQNIHTSQNYSVEDIVVMGITPYLGLFDLPKEEHYERGREILRELNIYHLKDKSIGELSGGERRMVYLGRVLMQKCKILLLDEPNTFLDYVRQNDFFTFIKKFVKEKNLISLFTIHDINLALRYGDNIYILDNNKIIEVINCKEEGYEEKIIKVLNKIYSRNFSIVETRVGPMVIC